MIGKPVEDPKEMTFFRAATEEKSIRGMVIYVDHYGNVLTNIDQGLFNPDGKYLLSVELVGVD